MCPCIVLDYDDVFFSQSATRFISLHSFYILATHYNTLKSRKIPLHAEQPFAWLSNLTVSNGLVWFGIVLSHFVITGLLNHLAFTNFEF